VKKIHFVLTILFISSIYSQIGYAQESNSEVIEIFGKVVDSDNKPVSFAHIVNIKKGLATISDTSGMFRMVMLRNDSLRVSCVGYNLRFFVLPPLLDREGAIYTIRLTTAVYELGMVNIFSERWNAFVYDYLSSETKEDKDKDRLIEQIAGYITAEELMQLHLAARGVGFPINFRTKRDKSIEKVREFIRQDELNRQANEKFNKDLVKKVTKLEDKELEQFMNYCRFDRDFILKISEYNLIVIIEELYDIYSSEKN